MESVLFDMDGTIVYSQPVAIQAMRNGLSSFYEEIGETYDLPSEREIIANIGLPSEEYFKAVVPEHLEHRHKDVQEHVCTRERKLIESGEMKFYDRMEDVLKDVSGKYHTGLVTNGGREYFTSIRNNLGLDRYFQQLHCVDDSPTGQKTDLVRELLHSLQPDASVLVGDKSYDREAAHDNGIPFVGVTWGYAEEGELDGAERVAEQPAELPGYIDELLEANDSS